MNQLDHLGPLYPSTVDLDRAVAQLLSGVVATMMRGGVSKRHVLASLARVLRYSGRAL